MEEREENFPKRTDFWTGKDAIVRGSDTFFDEKCNLDLVLCSKELF